MGSTVRKNVGRSVLAMVLVSSSTLGLPRTQNRNPVTTPVVYTVPDMSRAVVRSSVVFDNSSATPLALDAYLPGNLRRGERRPAIVFISGAERVRNWRWFITWGQLAAAHGLVGIVPDKRYPRGFEGTRAGFEDTEKLLAFLNTQGDALGVDPKRICLWTFSAGGRLTSVGLQPGKSDGASTTAFSGLVRCLVSFYGVLDISSELSTVANEADRVTMLKRYSPAHALEALVASGRKSPPVFIARAGKDSAFINNGIDHFTATALRLNAPITIVNYAEGDHGFDGYNDTSESRAIIKAALLFVQQQTDAKGDQK
jgi:acetyl esterase/lipase